jgi:hypothetical protein
MSRKKRADRKKIRRAKSYGKLSGIVVTAILGTATLVGLWAPTLGRRKIRSLFVSSPAPLPSPNNPSKEYIYAGGRLIATEEPGTGTPGTLAPPTSVAADTISNVEIDISWGASQNAHHYRVERASNLGGTFTVLDSNVTGTTYKDMSVGTSVGCNSNDPTSTVCAFVYRVLAADAAGNLSVPSNVDLATAIKFEDDPLPANAEVRAAHILQLRQAINAARAAANLGPAVWFQQNIQPGSTTILAKDVEELRTALDQALERFGLSTGGYTDPAPLYRVLIYKEHIRELRARLK